MDFKQYRCSQIAELTDWHEGFDMVGVSVSGADMLNGSPKVGDKIARNPMNHAYKWLVAAKYFAANFEPVSSPALALPEEPVCMDDHRRGYCAKVIAYIDSLRAAAEALSSKLNEAIDILSSVDDTGLLYKHNLDVDAKVANFLAQIDDEEKRKKWLFPR